MRDGDPKAHNTKKGLAAELLAHINVMAQPSCTPEVNVEDHTFWTALDRDMEGHVRDWEKTNHPKLFDETPAQLKARAQGTALSMPEEQIDAMMGHTKVNLQKLKDAKGWYIDG